jgi:hypothetical protein
VARTLLPDMLSYDPRRPASFPTNGRTLTDDAADAFLAVLTNGKVTGDRVGPHGDLIIEFPYLGSPAQRLAAELGVMRLLGMRIQAGCNFRKGQP